MKKQNKIPLLRFPSFTNEWQLINGDEIFESVSNKNHNSDLPILAITQDHGAIPRELIAYNISVTDKSIESYKVVEEGDFIISLRSFQGGIEYSNYKGICSPAYIILKPIKEIDRTFFKYYFKTPRYVKRLTKNLEGIRDGKMISFKYFSEAKLTFPSLPEQKRIASFFKVLEKKIDELKQKKSLLEQYKKGVMQKIFSQELRFKDEHGKEFAKWEKKKLNKIADIYDGTHQTPKYLEEGIPFYSVEHVTANDFQNTKFISKEVFDKENKRVKLERGDILMTRIGDIGTSRLINWDANASFYVSLALIKQSPKFSSEYLNQYISTRDFQSELWKRTIHVAFPQKINLGEIGDCFVMLPCIKEQTKIANFLSGIDEKINRTESQIQQTQEWKKGLLQNMFC